LAALCCVLLWSPSALAQLCAELQQVRAASQRGFMLATRGIIVSAALAMR
jgi:hypothetical protein